MVVKVMKWRPWPPLSPKKFEAKIILHRLKNLALSPTTADNPKGLHDFERLAVEIKWKGPKGNPFNSLRRSVRRNVTKEEPLREDGVVEWDEEFQSFCSFSSYKEGLFHPWEVAFTVINDLNQGRGGKFPVVASTSLNLADFASLAEGKYIEIDLSKGIHTINSSPLLCLSISLVELKTAQGMPEIMPKSVVSLPVSPLHGEVTATEKTDLSALKAGLEKVKIFKKISARRRKKECREEESDGKSSAKSEDVEYNYPFDTDSSDDLEEGEMEERKENSPLRKSFSYGTLAYANHAGEFYSNTSGSEDEDWIYYSHRKSDAGETRHKESITLVFDQSSQKSSKRITLPWRKRKLSFRSPKTKGEPLLKKYYGEEGGDDIDFDRRQLSSSDESTNQRVKDSVANRSSVSEFGDDCFAVGSWENKEIISRDGHMKLQTQVFFASIDQRSERAGGESACTALVAVIADWFQSNPNEMPIKSQLDSLIRDGSLEWRNLCENETYKDSFPDKHFDLETVLQAKVRPLSVVPEKSFVGFFHLGGIEGGKFDFLEGSMSFDNIWDEISQYGQERPSNGKPLVYIVSWNDHFFVLMVEQDAYYIIDTLGERLYEGCNQAFILKFDKDTTIEKHQESDKKTMGDKAEQDKIKEAAAKLQEVDADLAEKPEETTVCRGKEACKEYIKNFLAAIPLRELQVDIEKGLMASKPIHHRLQIEFNYTASLELVLQDPSVEAPANTPEILLIGGTENGN